MIKTNKITYLLTVFCMIYLNIVSWTCLCYFPGHSEWFFWESRLQHKCTWFGDYKSYEHFEFFWNFWKNKKFYENFEIMNFIKKNLIIEFIFKFFENFEILWNLMKTEIFEIFEILKYFKNFRVFVNRRWSPSVPNKYKTFIQSGRGTKSPRKRFTLPVHSLKNYGPLNSQTTGKGEK
jgi:hypothetical protein